MVGSTIFVPGIGKARLKLHSLIGFLLTTFVISYYLSVDSINVSSSSRGRVAQDGTVSTGDSVSSSSRGRGAQDGTVSTGDSISSWLAVEHESTMKMWRSKSSGKKVCDLFSGKWVFDNQSYPLYKEHECSFMPDDFACAKFGRQDSKYKHWRWQPHDCDLPRFDAKALLKKLIGKRLIFVGDSLNRNQWVSLVCMLESSIPPSWKSSTTEGNFYTFKAFEYNATVEFYWAPLLLESNCDHPQPLDHHVDHRIVRVGSIEKHARHWIDADILVFNSYMWWLKPEMTLLWGSFESSDGIYRKVDQRLPRYEMALRTWSYWLENHINQTKTRLFFMSLSPFHPIAEAWEAPAGGNCYGETEPICEEGYRGTETDSGMMSIAETAVYKLKLKGLNIEYLNITQLSDYRKDAHPSIHKKQFKKLTEEQLSNPKSYADCVHWCVPGVPDVWNQILYTYIMYS